MIASLVFYNILAIALIVVCTMTSNAFAKDTDWYREHGVIIVNPPDSAPMSFLRINGEPKGYIINLWRK